MTTLHPVLAAVTPTTAILLSFLALAIILVARGIKVVRQAEVMLVERLGKYHRTLTPGIGVLWPILDKTRDISWMTPVKAGTRAATIIKIQDRVDLREAVFDFPQQRVITRDNVV